MDFICAACGNVIPRTPGDTDEALAELIARSGPNAVFEDIEVICDDCFSKYLPWSKEHGYTAIDYEPKVSNG